MLATTATGFLIAWGPFAGLCIWGMVTEPEVALPVFFLALFSFFYQNIPHEYRFIASLFCKSATAYNPFIYFFMFKGFRKDTKNVLFRSFRDMSATFRSFRSKTFTFRLEIW